MTTMQLDHLSAMRLSAARSRRLRPRVLALACLVAVTPLAFASCGGGAGDTGEAPDATEAAAPDDSVVTLTAEAIANAGIATESVRVNRAGSAATTRLLEVPGHVELDPRRVAVVSARVDGRLEQLRAVEGDQVAAGDDVATVYSAAFVTAQSDLQLASRRATLLDATADAAGSRALAEAAAQRLRLMGVSEASVAALRAGGAPSALLALRAPISGSVLEAHSVAGRAVAIGEPILTVADLTELDVVAEIPEVSLPMVRVGQRARITVAAYPETQFVGTVERLRDVLDPETRTLGAVLHVPNAARVLRPGMYATVRLAVSEPAPRGGSARAFLIPESALVLDGAETIVFVAVGERTFVRRAVQVEALAPAGSLRPAGTDVLVRAGLRAGEVVVVRGAFVLKSELKKAAFSEPE